MRRYGIVSYNIYCNFTNYGSALQSWALQQTVDKLGNGRWKTVLVDYCPTILADKDPLNPIKNMLDIDEKARNMCELSMPAIRENYKKFDDFYNTRFNKTSKKYTPDNFNQIVKDEDLNGFICGSDTIFCIDEFEFEDGYYANYSCMKELYTIAYAASFGDAHFTSDTLSILGQKVKNFKAIGLRESTLLDYVNESTLIPVKRVLDPTLLLETQEYDRIAEKRIETEKYLLLYVRRYNPEMEKYAERLAEKNGWKIIEISLRADNAKKHRMFYEAGVEEFLSLVKYAEFVVTNSFHGAIFSIQFRRQFVVFAREQSNTKIRELLGLLGLSSRQLFSEEMVVEEKIDFEPVHEILARERKKSCAFIKECMERDQG